MDNFPFPLIEGATWDLAAQHQQVHLLLRCKKALNPFGHHPLPSMERHGQLPFGEYWQSLDPGCQLKNLIKPYLTGAYAGVGCLKHNLCVCFEQGWIALSVHSFLMLCAS